MAKRGAAGQRQANRCGCTLPLRLQNERPFFPAFGDEIRLSFLSLTIFWIPSFYHKNIMIAKEARICCQNKNKLARVYICDKKWVALSLSWCDHRLSCASREIEFKTRFISPKITRNWWNRLGPSLKISNTQSCSRKFPSRCTFLWPHNVETYKLR